MVNLPVHAAYTSALNAAELQVEVGSGRGYSLAILDSFPSQMNNVACRTMAYIPTFAMRTAAATSL